MTDDAPETDIKHVSPAEQAALEKYMSLPNVRADGPNSVDILTGDSRGFLLIAAETAQPDRMHVLDRNIRASADLGNTPQPAQALKADAPKND